MLTAAPDPGVGPPPEDGVPGFPPLLFPEDDPPEEVPPQPAKKSAIQVRRLATSQKTRRKVVLGIRSTPTNFLCWNNPLCPELHLRAPAGHQKTDGRAG